MLRKLWENVCVVLGIRDAEEDYQAGRVYAENMLMTQQPPSTHLLLSLWSQAGNASAFGGGADFDRGIADVLREGGHQNPESPC